MVSSKVSVRPLLLNERSLGVTLLTRRTLLASGSAATISWGIAASATAASDVRPAFGVGKPMRPNAARVVTAPNTFASKLPDIGRGAAWQDVRALQYLLLANGFKVASWETSYGPNTSAAVLAYQRRYALAGSGVAVSSTLARLAVPTSRGQNTYRTFAIQTLLKKHGYRFGDGAAPAMTTIYDANTDALTQSFQTSHGLGTSQVGPLTWATLFAEPTCGPVYPLAQAGTGNAQWNNCGPTSAVTLLIARGLVPNGWAWNIDARFAAPAVSHFRYVAMGVPSNAARDAKGTGFAELRTGFATYGLRNVTLTNFGGGLADVRKGFGIMLSGDAHRLPWPTRTRGPNSHWITVVGFDGTNYLAVDPISAVGSTVVHRISEAQLNDYVAGKHGSGFTGNSAVLVH